MGSENHNIRECIQTTYSCTILEAKSKDFPDGELLCLVFRTLPVRSVVEGIANCTSSSPHSELTVLSMPVNLYSGTQQNSDA